MSLVLSEDCRVQRSTKHLTATVQDESVVLHGVDGVYFGLNGTGTRVWGMLSDATSVREIVTALFQEFDAPREVVLRDVLAILQEMLASGLIELRDKC